MSGHSKWATIHRKKGLIDAERGKIFQKLAKEIMVAARGTNGDIDSNASLRAVVEKARSNNMPKDNIQKAIDKARELGFDQLELGVYADNERAMGLYKKMGFKEFGRTPRAFKLKDGTYIDEVNMVLFLN